MPDFSLDEWLKEKGSEVAADIQEDLQEAGREALFKLLGVYDWMLKPPCDQTRAPFSPSSNGWNNRK